MNHLNNIQTTHPVKLTFDRETVGGTITRKLQIIYSNGSSSPLYTLAVNPSHLSEEDKVGIKFIMSHDGSSITVTEDSNYVSYNRVSCNILFEDYTSAKPSSGTIQGGILSLHATTGSCSCETQLSGYPEPIQLGIEQEFSVLIIGVDDIRARTGHNFNQNFALQGQELLIRLDAIPSSPNVNLVLKYGKK